MTSELRITPLIKGIHILINWNSGMDCLSPLIMTITLLFRFWYSIRYIVIKIMWQVLYNDVVRLSPVMCPWIAFGYGGCRKCKYIFFFYFFLFFFHRQQLRIALGLRHPVKVHLCTANVKNLCYLYKSSRRDGGCSAIFSEETHKSQQTRPWHSTSSTPHNGPKEDQ